ncbi:MAG: tetratricopeptide repeat protein, partial [Burkholderiales bacterium]|nr:tetratricopeptide repeat protein [Anaerolineae bacterium]
MLRRQLLIAALAAVLTGCSLMNSVAVDPQVIYVTATTGASEALSTPDAIAQAPTIPPTATIAPTPTTPPDVLLRVADRYLLNGYFENAVASYQEIITQGSPDDIRASAAFRLGQAALREGLFNNAIESLTLFIDQFPQDARIAQAHFLRGDAYLGLSLWQDAIAEFQFYLGQRPGIVDSYAYERIGDAQLALGQTNDAQASYAQATAASRSLVPQLILREKVAQVYLSAGLVNEAVAEYDAILTVAQNAPYRASIEYAAAKALMDAGATEPGMERMQRIFNDYAGTSEAYQAMGVLTANGRELDAYARGRAAFQFGDYQGALDAFNIVTSTRLLADIPPELYMMLGQAYREIGSNAAALTAFQTVVEQYPQNPLFGQALLEQGRTRFISGDVQGAITHYLSIADTYDYLPEAPEALWRAGYLYSTNNRPDESSAIFERLADAYPTTTQAADGLFIAASAAINANDTVDAERLFAKLATTTTGDDQAAAYLWVGRLARQRGDNATADSALQLAISSAPDSYFAARAADISSGRPPFQRPAQYQFEFDDIAQLAESEAWLRQTFSITQEGALWALSPALEADARMIRGRELWALAAYEAAEEEFSDVIEENKDNGLASYQLAIFLRGIGAYSQSIQAAAYVIISADVATLEAPAYIARMRYPAYYADVVLEVAQRRDLDPLL